MELTKGTYEIRRKEFLDGIVETITISKEEMEAWRNHCKEMAGKELEKEGCTNSLYGNYMGMTSILSDLINYFKDEPHKGMND